MSKFKVGDVVRYKGILVGVVSKADSYFEVYYHIKIGDREFSVVDTEIDHVDNISKIDLINVISSLSGDSPDCNKKIFELINELYG